jgi:lauroyl/myristoyl acyltransferase
VNKVFPAQNAEPSPTGPSSLYRASVWRWGYAAARMLPAWLLEPMSGILAAAYWRGQTPRRTVVIENLLPGTGGDLPRATALSRALFRQFALKLLDLWRLEAGLSIEHLFSDWQGWPHFQAARERGRGVLLLTPHLGNWELGAPLLAQRGVSLLVITLEEPEPGLTALRQASRARRGVETLVIGQDPFAFLEVIRRLEAGATVALLVDRPVPASAATVELFGRPFLASIAAAELARATGCTLLPVCLPRVGDTYRAEVLAPVEFDRLSLGSRPARQALTQQIMRAFQPVIQQYLAQWYHFVPIWPAASTHSPSDERP